MRLFYFLLLIFSAAFHILYKGDLSFILLMFVLILPLIMLVMLIITVRSTAVSAYFEQRSAERGKSAVLKVTVRNRSVFPVTRCVVDAVYVSSVPFDAAVKNRYRLSAALGAHSSETFALNISAAHCGTVYVYIKKIKLMDLMGLFAIPVKSSISGRITSLPVIYPIQASVESSPVLTDEGTAFSPHKPGDDPSEIFALREYREGDNNNRIHWKLSSRSENFIVKELSLPVGCRILVAVDFFGCKNAAATDRILDAAYSISDFLAEHGTAHTVAFACSDYSIHRSEISNHDKRLLAAVEICSELKHAAVDSAFARAAVSDDYFAAGRHYSRVIVVSDSIDAARADELEELFREAYITVICTGAPDAVDDDEIRMEIIYADAEKLSNHELLII